MDISNLGSGAYICKRADGRGFRIARTGGGKWVAYCVATTRVDLDTFTLSTVRCARRCDAINEADALIDAALATIKSRAEPAQAVAEPSIELTDREAEARSEEWAAIPGGRTPKHLS